MFRVLNPKTSPETEPFPAESGAFGDEKWDVAVADVSSQRPRRPQKTDAKDDKS